MNGEKVVQMWCDTGWFLISPGGVVMAAVVIYFGLLLYQVFRR